jgi:DNA-binding beta-propeller fold protein YncE
VVVSPDGRNVYVASVGGLTVFARDARSGALRQLAGSAGCLLASRQTADCSHRGALHGLSPTVVAVSPDGRNVYTVTHWSAGEALVVFRRNRTSGALTQAGCVANPAIKGAGCAAAASFEGPWGCYSLALSPDSRSLYVGTCGDLIVFSRTAAGGLKQTGCIDAIGPRGHPCEGDTGDWPATGIAVSPDGRNLYFAYSDGRRPEPGGIAVFARAANGSLTRLRGAAGCLTWDGSKGVCTNARGVDNPFALALSPDGRNLYSSGFSGIFCRCWNGVVAVFRRTP